MVFSGSSTSPVERGCGVRQEGGIYFESGLSPDGRGMPLEWFMKDRPVLLDADALGLSAIGVKLIQDKAGTYHVLDIVGREGYPNWADFLEEVRRFGLSRRAGLGVDFGKLTSDSRIMLAHSRAYFDDWAAYTADRVPRIGWDTREDEYEWEYCPKHPAPSSDPEWLSRFFGTPHDQHGAEFGQEAPGFCAGLWWDDLSVAADREETRPYYTSRYEDARDLAVAMPSFTYYGRKSPIKKGGPGYRLAIGLVMPLTNLVVIDGGDSAKAISALERAGMDVGDDGDEATAESNAARGKLPVFLVQE